MPKTGLQIKITCSAQALTGVATTVAPALLLGSVHGERRPPQHQRMCRVLESICGTSVCHISQRNGLQKRVLRPPLLRQASVRMHATQGYKEKRSASILLPSLQTNPAAPDLEWSPGVAPVAHTC